MDKLIESLESLKWWITLYVTGDLTCGEVREKLEVIDAVIKELKKRKDIEFVHQAASCLNREDIELLIKVCDFYHTVSYALAGACELDTSYVGDALARLKIGEYMIVRNPDY